MGHSSAVTALRIADEDFLVASTIERCPKTMMIRVLLRHPDCGWSQAAEFPGSKERPGRTGKRGDKYIRSLLVAGAVAT